MNMLRIVFAILPLAVAQIPQSTLVGFAQVVAPFESECICETHVDPLLIKKWIFEHSFPQDPCFKCYIKCVFRRINLINFDGTFSLEENSNLNNYVPGRTPEITIPCITQTSNITDVCEKAYEFSLCVQNAMIKNAQQTTTTP
ncbi:hypothetical protein FQR65_LT01956 [Abscondita terminalis]|nr:hypothetical protein FQR65_LT01956 [Abscondita terminalis]